MNRQQRRTAGRRPETMTRQQLAYNIAKNGITMRDLEANHRIGYEQGWKAAQDHFLATCYAAAIRVLRRNADVTPAQCAEFLREMDLLISTEIDGEEAIAAAFEETGVAFDFAEALPEDRITEVPSCAAS